MGDERAPQVPEAEDAGGLSFMKVALIALAICLALVGGAVFFLRSSSQLPFNYQGFDK